MMMMMITARICHPANPVYGLDNHTDSKQRLPEVH